MKAVFSLIASFAIAVSIEVAERPLCFGEATGLSTIKLEQIPQLVKMTIDPTVGGNYR